MSLAKQMLSLGSCASAVLLVSCAEGKPAEDVELAAGKPKVAPAVAGAAMDPAARLAAATDRNWINLSGTIVSAGPSTFLLDYGPGTVTVEMDDWDWYQEGKALVAGDEVVVTGKIDDDLYQAQRIEASSVFAKKLNTYFYASGADEENLAESTVYVRSGPTSSDTTGYVTAVEGREFTVGSNSGAIRVDTSKMSDNPLDGEGPQQVKVGDRVYVWGDLDIEPRERVELMAKGVISLTKDSGKTNTA